MTPLGTNISETTCLKVSLTNILPKEHIFRESCFSHSLDSHYALTNAGVIIFPFSSYCASGLFLNRVCMLTILIYFWACNTGTNISETTCLKVSLMNILPKEHTFRESCFSHSLDSHSVLTNAGVIIFPFSSYCASGLFLNRVCMLTILIYFWACNTGTFLDVSSLLPPVATDVYKRFTWELWNGDCIDSQISIPHDGKGCTWGLCNRPWPNGN